MKDSYGILGGEKKHLPARIEFSELRSQFRSETTVKVSNIFLKPRTIIKKPTKQQLHRQRKTNANQGFATMGPFCILTFLNHVILSPYDGRGVTDSK